MPVFEDAATAVGEALGADATIGGYVLGILIVFALVAFLASLIGERLGSMGMMITLGLSMTIPVMFGWWPMWTLMFIAILAVLGIFMMRGSNNG